MKKRFIPVAKPYFTKAEGKAAAKALETGWVVQGPQVKLFEEKIADYVGAKYAVATTSATTALHLALIVAGIGKGDEVIVPSFSYIATANSVLYTGAKPVFADVDPRTFNIDPIDIEKKITKKTKAIIPVDQAGMPADYDPIKKLAKKYNLLIIEDAACGLGAKYNGKMLGSLADITCFSYHARKLITAGEGGMFVTNNANYAKQGRILRTHGASLSDFEKHGKDKLVDETWEVLGYNYRMTDIQAAILNVQFEHLPFILKRRYEDALAYNEAFKDIPYVEIPYVPPKCETTYQAYFLKIRDNSPVTRDRLIDLLLADGIATRKGVYPAHVEPLYRNIYPKLSLPVTEKLSKTILNLPLYTDMKKTELAFVIKRLKHHLKVS